MKANIVNGKKCHPIMNFGIVGQVKAKKITLEQAEKFFPNTVCGQGSCVGLYTANTMATITEVLGMSITRCSTTLAINPKKKKQAYETGKKSVELVKKI